MKSDVEIRSEAWSLLWKRNWFWTLLGAYLLLQLASQFILNIVVGALAAVEVFNLSSVVELVSEQKSLPQFTSQLVWQLASSSVLIFFFAFILGGISSYGNAVMLVRAADDDPEDWLKAAFGGYRMPLGLAWLAFLLALVFVFWALLAVLPAAAIIYAAVSALPAEMDFGAMSLNIAASTAAASILVAVLSVPFYRYRYVFRLKADHPDWSATQCIRGCAELTYGYKWRAFKLDCSYWRILLLVLLPALVTTATVFALTAALAALGDGQNSLVALALTAGGVLVVMASNMTLIVFLLIAVNYIGLGQTILYREIARERQELRPDEV